MVFHLKKKEHAQINKTVKIWDPLSQVSQPLGHTVICDHYLIALGTQGITTKSTAGALWKLDL